MSTPFNQQIFLNLPVQDLEKSKAFYTALGYTVNAQFTNEQAACIVVSEQIFVMLLVKEFFQTFTKKPLSDAKKSTEVLVALSCESRAAVEAQVAKALAAGGATPVEAKDYGFMYQHGYEDPDGHQWEVFYMDMSAAPAQA